MLGILQLLGTVRLVTERTPSNEPSRKCKRELSSFVLCRENAAPARMMVARDIDAMAAVTRAYVFILLLLSD